MRAIRTLTIDKERLDKIIALINEKFGTDYTVVDTISNQNPFDISGSYELSNRTILSFRMWGDQLSMRIGKKSGWVGGLEWDECWFGGDLKSVSLVDVKECLDSNYGVYDVRNKPYSTVGESLFRGNIEECEKWMVENGYTLETNSHFSDEEKLKENYHKYRYATKKRSYGSDILVLRVS